ncbi:MAG TPA: nitrous oxide reductase accessory protein NosL [Hyphomicrobium sp.]|nr:nitrous oxide reductase accessory protein NosL [Hyphomicrobium sp.]
MSISRFLAISMVTLLCACGPQAEQAAKPREPDKNAIGFFCRMGVTDHDGPKGQILPKGWNDPLWFSSVRDALTYAEMEVVSENEIASFWVNDMGQGTWARPAPGAWVSARAAWYVIGSRMTSGMGGGEAVPFKERSAADAFVSLNGGRVVDYGEAKRSIASGESGGET